MSLESLLAARGPIGHFNRFLYGSLYTCLRGIVLMCFRPYYRVRRVGPPPNVPEGPVIFCANHASYLDPAFLQLVVRRRVSFVMTNDFYRRAWGRWFFYLVRAIPTGRGALARQSLRRALEVLLRGDALALFPEGRLSTTGELGHAQRGVAFLARLGRAPVIPVGIAGSRRAWPKGARWMRKANVRVAFGPRIAPPDAGACQARDEQQAYADQVLDAIARAREAALRQNGPGSR